MEPVIDTFAVVNSNRLDRRNIMRQPLDKLFWRGCYLNNGINVIIFQMHLVHLKNGHDLDLFTINGLQLERTFNRGVNAFCCQLLTHVVSGNRFWSFCLRIPNNEVSNHLPLFIFKTLYLIAWPMRDIFQLVAWYYIFRAQPLQGIRPDKQWEVGKLLHVVCIVQLLVHQYLGNSQEERRIGVTLNRYPIICLLCRCTVLRGNNDELSTPLYHLSKPMGLRHLIFNKVLAGLYH